MGYNSVADVTRSTLIVYASKYTYSYRFGGFDLPSRLGLLGFVSLILYLFLWDGIVEEI